MVAIAETEHRFRDIFRPALKPTILAAALLLAACGHDGKEPATAQASTKTTARKATGSAYTVPSEEELAVPEVTLPAPVPISIKTEKECLQDLPEIAIGDSLQVVPIDGKEFLIGTLDGSCNVPLSSEKVGLTKQADQSSEPSIAAKNGESVLLECYSENPNNEVVGDITAGSRSKIWWQIIYNHAGKNERWLVPAVNLTGDDPAYSFPCET